jgi:CBS domain-containing protein
MMNTLQIVSGYPKTILIGEYRINIMITIENWMSKPVTTVKSDDTVYEAINRMVKKGIGDVVVIDKDKKPIGIVTERDILKRVLAKKKDFMKVKIEDIMTKNITTASTNSTFLEIARIMRKGSFRRLPITKNGKLVGIVTSRDIINFMSL